MFGLGSDLKEALENVLIKHVDRSSMLTQALSKPKDDGICVYLYALSRSTFPYHLPHVTMLQRWNVCVYAVSYGIPVPSCP